MPTLSSWRCEGKELSGKKETSPSKKSDTTLEAVCPANLKNAQNGWKQQVQNVKSISKYQKVSISKKKKKIYAESFD